MIRYDPNSFVQSLMGGMQTGIQLGQNADAQRFARERAAVQDQQTAFGNQMALDSQAMRRAQIEQEAADRAERVAEKERTRMATEQGVKFLMADDETFTSNLPQIAEVLKDAPAGLQNSVVNRRAALRERETRLGQFESLKAQGAKFDENNVKYFEDYGIIVPKDLKAKSLREQDDINDAQDREALIVNAVRQGTLAWEELPTFSKIKNTTLLHSILTQRGAVLAAQQKALADQQAAAQKQQQQQALVPALDRFRGGSASSQDLVDLKNGDMITASAITPNKPNPDGLSKMVDDNLSRATDDMKYWRSKVEEAGLLVKQPDGSMKPNEEMMKSESEKNLTGGQGSTPLNTLYMRYQAAQNRVQQLMSDPNRYSGRQGNIAPQSNNADDIARTLIQAGKSDHEITQELRRLGVAQ